MQVARNLTRSTWLADRIRETQLQPDQRERDWTAMAGRRWTWVAKVARKRYWVDSSQPGQMRMPDQTLMLVGTADQRMRRAG